MVDNAVRCNNPWCQSTNVVLLEEVPRLPQANSEEELHHDSSNRPVAMHCNSCGKDFVREVPLSLVPKARSVPPHSVTPTRAR